MCKKKKKHTQHEIIKEGMSQTAFVCCRSVTCHLVKDGGSSSDALTHKQKVSIHTNIVKVKHYKKHPSASDS